MKKTYDIGIVIFVALLAILYSDLVNPFIEKVYGGIASISVAFIIALGLFFLILGLRKKLK